MPLKVTRVRLVDVGRSKLWQGLSLAGILDYPGGERPKQQHVFMIICIGFFFFFFSFGVFYPTPKYMKTYSFMNAQP